MSKGSKIFLILVIIIVIVGAGFFIWKNEENKTEGNNITNTTTNSNTTQNTSTDTKQLLLNVMNNKQKFIEITYIIAPIITIATDMYLSLVITFDKNCSIYYLLQLTFSFLFQFSTYSFISFSDTFSLFIL